MIVLGLDTATAATAAGLWVPGTDPLEAVELPAPGARPGHASRLLALAEQLLSQAGMRWRDVRRIAVGTGPGSFTGLRIGIATARALAQARDAELIGVGTLRCLAVRAAASDLAAPDARAPVGQAGIMAVLDARRGQAFAAAYRPLGGLGPTGAARVEEVLAPCVLAPEALSGAVASGSGWWAVGDGALSFRDHLEPHGIGVPGDGSPLHRVSPATLCRLGAAGPAVALQELAPQYLRAPDAETALRREA